MLKLLCLVVLCWGVLSFQPFVLKRTRNELKMMSDSERIIEITEIPGKGPTGYFDPLNLSSGLTLKDIKKWRESELKHGRLAML